MVVTGTPLTNRPMPPAGLVERLKFYGRRNGYGYALLSYVGRKSAFMWRVLGPLFTPPRVRAWLKRPGPRVLNLGGGANTWDRWLTADMDPRADVYVNLVQPLPFPNDSIDVVYLEEVIEHVPCEAALALLRECRRIMKAGAFIRLTTPDLGAYANQFDGSLGLEERFNNIFYEHGHCHIYSQTGLQELLVKAGFKDQVRSSFQDPASRFGYFDTHALRFDLSERSTTQYWEARK